MTQREDSFLVYHRHERVSNTKLPPAWITHRVMRVRRILPVPARNNAFRLQRLSIGCCSPGSNTIDVTFSPKNTLCENDYRFTTDPWFLSFTEWLCRTPFSTRTNTRQEFFVKTLLPIVQRKNIVRKHLLYSREMLNEILSSFDWIFVIARSSRKEGDLKTVLWESQIEYESRSSSDADRWCNWLQLRCSTSLHRLKIHCNFPLTCGLTENVNVKRNDHAAP